MPAFLLIIDDFVRPLRCLKGKPNLMFLIKSGISGLRHHATYILG